MNDGEGTLSPRAGFAEPVRVFEAIDPGSHHPGRGADQPRNRSMPNPWVVALAAA